MAAKYPDLLDGMVFMSSAPDIRALLTSFAGSGMSIASLNNDTRFGKGFIYLILHGLTRLRLSLGSLNSSYLVSGDIYDAQQSLFHFPYFDPGT